MGLSGAGPGEMGALAAASGGRYEPDPRGSAPARAAVCAYYAARGLEVDPARLVLTAGTSEAYAHLFRLLADPGGRFLVPSPSYPLFEPLAALEGVELERYRLAFHGRWHLDLEALDRAFRGGASGVVVVQPNHPTGSCLAPAEIGHLESLCEAHGAAIVSDEVFGDFPWPPAVAPLPSLLGPRRVPTFVLSGLSKVCGMPGMKLSWIALAGPDAACERALAGLEWIADLRRVACAGRAAAAARSASRVPAAGARAAAFESRDAPGVHRAPPRVPVAPGRRRVGRHVARAARALRGGVGARAAAA